MRLHSQRNMLSTRVSPASYTQVSESSRRSSSVSATSPSPFSSFRRASSASAISSDYSPSPSLSPLQEAFDIESIERQVYALDRQTSATLTVLLSCDTAKEDEKFRKWVQSRLLEKEHDLKDYRRRRLLRDFNSDGYAFD